jgi:phytanoyl-CoA hydroxylase
MFSKSELHQFHRDGIIVARGLIRGPELDALRAAADRVMADGIESQDPGQHQYRENDDGSMTYHRSEWMWGRDPIFKAVTVNPELLTRYGQLLGHTFMPIMDSFVCKIPGGDVPVPWHQDPPYGEIERVETHPIPNIDADIYLDHSTVENGCLWVIPGHHLVGHVEIDKFSEQELFEQHGAIPIEMAPGDVSFHCLSAPHGSIGNRTSTPRRTFYVHYSNEEVIDQCYRHLSYIQAREDAIGFFDDRAHSAVHDMLETREAMGYAGIEDSEVRFTDDGFEYLGDVGTPARHWGTLIAQMSADEIGNKKKLTYTSDD